MTSVTLGTSDLWLGTKVAAGDTTTLDYSFFWPHPMAPWTTGCNYKKPIVSDFSKTLMNIMVDNFIIVNMLYIHNNLVLLFVISMIVIYFINNADKQST